MTTKQHTQIEKDLPGKTITVTRYFAAEPALVWRAWTEQELLDQWWAPKPYRAETKYLQFSPGGHWLYAMVSPEGERHWARMDFKNINAIKRFTAKDSFCDENGTPVSDPPGMDWDTGFHADGDGTRVKVELTFASEANLKKIVEMGFEEGFTAALGNLERYLATFFKIRGELKTGGARVTTYLNFPGKTEEAFNFYQKAFNGEFTGRGLQRFGDTEMPAEMPPMDEATKKLIIHAELTILGGHVLMATDSPESMGFTLEHGNNMHINVEPETREETKRLFDILSEDGTVTMPLQNMFWGAYFGTFTDKYGINWILNWQEKIE